MCAELCSCLVCCGLASRFLPHLVNPPLHLILVVSSDQYHSSCVNDLIYSPGVSNLANYSLNAVE